MTICRHFRPVIGELMGCAAGRIAFLDCGPGCSVYDEDSAPEQRPTAEREAWTGKSENKSTPGA
jgi:hypothetical protein